MRQEVTPWFIQSMLEGLINIRRHLKSLTGMTISKERQRVHVEIFSCALWRSFHHQVVCCKTICLGQCNITYIAVLCLLFIHCKRENVVISCEMYKFFYLLSIVWFRDLLQKKVQRSVNYRSQSKICFESDKSQSVAGYFDLT